MAHAHPPLSPTPPNRLVAALGIAVAALLLSLVFHSPRLWVFAHAMPGSTYWDRGLQFMAQCDAPFGAPVADAALTWRLAPMLAAKALGLHGSAALLVPWGGVLVLLAQCAWLLLRRTGDARIAALATGLVGTTSAVLTVTGWLGMNDAWYAAALVAVAFQPTLVMFALAAIVGPWIDERFILALPLALYCRQSLGSGGRLKLAIVIGGASVLLYTVVRLGNLLHLATGSSADYWAYVFAHFLSWWPWLSLGWFMGLRAAWVLVAVAIAGNWRREELSAAWWPALLAAAPLLVMAVLASDSSRAPTMLLPLVLVGVERALALHGLDATRRLLSFLLLANLVLPAMHVTHQNVDVINSLPVEWFRWLKHG